MLSASASSPRQIRYVVYWRRVPQTVALVAAAGVWVAFLVHGG